MGAPVSAWRSSIALLALLAAACGNNETPTAPTQPSVLAIRCPADVAAEADDPSGAIVPYPPAEAVGGRAPVSVGCSPRSDSPFPPGTTRVTCTAVDASAVSESCSFGINVFVVPRLLRTDFLAFGDSVTAGEITEPLPSSPATALFFRLRVVPEMSYPTKLQTLLRSRYRRQAAEIRVINAGRSGETAVEGARRFPAVLSSERPQVVLILEGFNDINVFGTSAIEREASAIRSMARLARSAGATTYVAGLTPSRPGGRNTIPNPVLLTFNARLEAAATSEGAIFVDLLQPLSVDVGGYIGVDGLHPTERGYDKIAETFAAAVAARLERQP